MFFEIIGNKKFNFDVPIRNMQQKCVTFLIVHENAFVKAIQKFYFLCVSLIFTTLFAVGFEKTVRILNRGSSFATILLFFAVESAQLSALKKRFCSCYKTFFSFKKIFD